MFNSEQLDALSRLDLDMLDQNSLVDITNVNIDKNLPASVRMQQYLEQINNPYCFMCGSIPVKIRFSSDGSELETLLKQHFIALKR